MIYNAQVMNLEPYKEFTTNREQDLASVLEPLQGRSREVMGAILESVPTEKLDETFKSYIKLVLHEANIEYFIQKLKRSMIIPKKYFF